MALSKHLLDGTEEGYIEVHQDCQYVAEIQTWDLSDVKQDR
jgi:hypothetical protein